MIYVTKYFNQNPKCFAEVVPAALACGDRRSDLPVAAGRQSQGIQAQGLATPGLPRERDVIS